MNDVPREANFFQSHDGVIRQIDLPPLVAVAGHALIGVMVVVPTFAPAEQADPPEVLAVVGKHNKLGVPSAAPPQTAPAKNGTQPPLHADQIPN